jgi:magnesium chelatase family protein
MLAIVRACALVGLDGCIIEVQTDFNPRVQIPSFVIVGLPDNAVRESRERVRAAIKNSRGLTFPNKGYVVNLSPANLPKHGPAYDLAIAVGVLAVTDQIPMGALEKAVFVGELSLDGTIRHTQGVLSMAYAAKLAGYESIYVAEDDAAQAALVEGINVYPIATLGQLVEHLYELNPITPHPTTAFQLDAYLPEGLVDFAEIKGQEHIKRALEIAAAGNHNILMQGPPGVGKTLLARAMPGILPPLSLAEALEVSRIYSVADLLSSDQPLLRARPFRAPHHTISQAGLVGGGTTPKPGEISLAHRGVLFLDELPEFGPKALEVLRQPLEDRIVTISRASGTLTFPANFLMIAAQNPCPCGYHGDSLRACTCSPAMITRYQSRVSGPLMDRIDLHVEVPRVDYDKLLGDSRAETSSAVRGRVLRAREQQGERFQNYPGIYANADMGAGDVQTLCEVTPDAKQILSLSVKRMQLSARAYHRVLKLSRTIADLAESARIEPPHVAEALQYRMRATAT